MKRLVIIGLFLGGSILVGCARYDYYRNGLYDYSLYRFEKSAKQLEAIAESIYVVKTKALMKIANTELEPFETSQEGSAFSIDGFHLIALRHVTEIQTKYKFAVPPLAEPVEVSTEILEQHYYATGDHEIELLKNTSDIAVMYANSLVFNKLPVPLGNSNDLKSGMALLISSTPGMKGHCFRSAMVAEVNAFEMCQEEIEDDLDKAFMVAGALTPGDSGNPIFALRDGKLELIGICQGTIQGMDSLGWGLKINYVIETVDGLIANKRQADFESLQSGREDSEGGG